MSTPKIIFISGSMPLGGGSTSILNLCDGLRSEGTWEPHVAVIGSTGTTGEQIISAGHRFHGPCKGPIHEDRMQQMVEICRSLKPQIVVAALGTDAFEFLRYVPNGCLRVAMVQSDDPGVYSGVSRYSEWIDVVAGVSQEICRRLGETLGPQRIAISYQPYGVPMPLNTDHPLRADALRILYLGRVEEEQKRIGLMKRIIWKSLEHGHPIQWTIAGGGDELPGMREEFSSQPEQVTFLGPVPYVDVPGLFQRHDVYFLCSDYEGLPLSLLEAMGSGLIPVVSDLPSGISEVVSSENGIRVSIDDEPGYAQALIHLCENRDLLDGMSERSIAAARERFSIAAMTTRWLDMMNERSSGAAPDWSAPVKTHAPLQFRNRLFFHPALRALRRVAKRTLHG